MTLNHFARLAAGAAAASMLLAAGAASAQQAAAPQAGSLPRSGPPITGVCILSQQRAIGGSTVGKYVGDRMKQLEAQVTAELTPEGNSLNTDLKAYQAQAASLTPDARKQREAALQQRVDGIQRKQQIRGRELEVTRAKAVNRILTELNPIARSAYESRNCSLLLNEDAVLFANPAMDITDAVVQQLNAKITQFPFEREHLDQQAAAAAPAAPKPAGKKQ
jgi:outer membrane protein